MNILDLTGPNFVHLAFFAMATLTKNQKIAVIGGVLCVGGRKRIEFG
jgi:hypothetical protein